MELTGTVGTLFHSYARVLNVAVFLTFNTSYRNADTLPDVDQVIINTDATCELICCICVSASHFKHGGGQLLSGCLHQEAAIIESGGRSFFSLIL